MTNSNDLIHSFNAIGAYDGNFKGLTKLEYFAAMAMQGLLAGNPLKPGIDMVLIANDSVRMAKFLTTELNKYEKETSIT